MAYKMTAVHVAFMWDKKSMYPYKALLCNYFPRMLIVVIQIHYVCSIKYYDMDIALPKKNQSFRLPVELIERLRQLAKRQNRSLNNYVETLLLDAAYSEPNEITLAAMKEAQSGALRNTTPLDLSSVEAMERSMGLYRSTAGGRLSQ